MREIIEERGYHNVEPNNSPWSFFQNSLKLPNSGSSYFSTILKGRYLKEEGFRVPLAGTYTHAIKKKKKEKNPRQKYNYVADLLKTWVIGNRITVVLQYIGLTFSFYAICSYMCSSIHYHIADFFKII